MSSEAEATPPPTVVEEEASSPSSDERWRPDPSPRRTRFPRACNSRPCPRLLPPPDPRRSPESSRKREERRQSAHVVTPLGPPRPASPSRLPRWEVRSMWELASVLNFLHVFRPLLNVEVEFSAEELETALITPNNTLAEIHIPLLKATPPVIRMAFGHATWITVLCKKLKHWCHWAADGELPIVASQGTEIETYRTLDPRVRVLILKALCDIRVEQEDIRAYIDNSLKHGSRLSAFRRERIGGDSHGISYWYEDDPIIGHRLYREIRHFEATKVKGKLVPCPSNASYQWKTVATNLDEFQEVSDKLFQSKNRTEVTVGKKLKIDLLPEIEKIQKRKEKLLKKQHRQALLLDSFLSADGISSGRALRDRKPVTYTFDDYDRSINEAIKITKKRQTSAEPAVRREAINKPNPSSNGKWNDLPHISRQISSNSESAMSDCEEMVVEHHAEPLDCRKRKKPQRCSEKEYVEAVPDELDFNSDDDIVGEAVYDEEYIRSRKQRKVANNSDGDEEYRWEDEAIEDEGDEDDESFSISEDTDERPQHNKLSVCSRRGTKIRSVDELQSGLRRSRRSTRQHINYKQYEFSDSEANSGKHDKSSASYGHSGASNELQASSSSQEESRTTEGCDKLEDRGMSQDQNEDDDKLQQSHEKTNSLIKGDNVRRQFLDLNELAPVTGFDVVSSTMMKDEDDKNF